tara:strand:+ start:1939 stop:2436 length:498 start_codon:yes stop_codon:yes gene_type:complete
MDDIKNLPKSEKDFELLNNVCLDIVNETTYDDGRDWTQDEINLFVSQFTNAYEEDPIVDMNKLDPHFVPYEKFAEKYHGFDESVIQMLWECEEKKLEDARIAPLRVKRESIKMTDSLSNIIYTDGEKESISKADSSANSKSDNWGTTEEEAEKGCKKVGYEEASI